VRLVTKNVRGLPVAFFGSDGLAGLDMQGLKPNSFEAAIGTIKIVP
jgi:hypothetical protein